MINILKVDYLNLNRINKPYKKDFLNSINELFNSKKIVLGENTIEFENNYSNYNGIKYSLGVSNGLDAILLCLKSIGVSNNDEIIVPSNTYIATWNAISILGAKIIPCEPDLKTLNINPKNIESLITKNTKAILAVNLYGRICDFTSIQKICKKYNLYLIEDNAQAQGAELNGKKSGTFGDVNATSFYPTKNLGAIGEAGAITTNSKPIYDKIKALRNYGSNETYINIYDSGNYRIDEIQSIFLNLKIKNLDKENLKRIDIAKLYYSSLSKIEEIEMPKFESCLKNVYHIFPILIEKRLELKKYLSDQGITTLIHYPIPPHKQKAFKHLKFKNGDFPISEYIANRELSLPIDPYLTKKEINYIINKILNFYKK